MLTDLLKDADAEIRVQALKCLADVPTTELINDTISHRLADDSPRVRFYAAIVVARAKLLIMPSLLMDMIEQNADKDPFLRHAGAYALAETMNEDGFLALNNHPNTSVRLATVVALRRLKSELLADYVEDEDPGVSDEAIRAIHDLMLEKSRPHVAALLDQRDGVKRSEMMWRRLLHSAFRIGGPTNAKRLLAAAAHLGT